MVYIPHRSIISSEYHHINEEEQKEANKDIKVTIRTLIPTTEVEEYVVKPEVLTQYPQPQSFETGTVTNPLRNLGPEFDLQGTLKIMELSEDSYNRETRYNVTWEALETSCELVRSQEYTIDGEVFSDQTEVGDTDHTASEGTILEFDCGLVEGGSVFIKTDQNVLEVAETKMFGVSGRISPLVDPLDFPGLEASHIYHVTLQKGIDKNILILRENGEYIGEEQPSYIFKLNTDNGGTSEFELRRDSGLRMKDCLNAEVSDGWWPFSGTEGVCDGTKSEDKFNTWTLHFSIDHLLVYCDGVQFISLHLVHLYCTVFTPVMTEEGIFAVLNYSKSVDVLLMPGLLGLDVYHLGEYGVTKMEADHQFQRSCKNIERDIMELCTEEYDMFGADGVVSPEFQFLYDHIMDEFKTSIAYTALLSQIESDERIKREEQWMKDSYPENLESMFKKTRGNKENLEYVKMRKEEILSSLRRDSRLMQHDTISELFKKASIFYTSMSSLFEDRLNPLVDEFDLFARGDGVRPVLFKEIEGLITSLQDRVKATPSSIGRPQEMTTGVWQTVVPEAWETQSLFVKFKNENNGKTDWRWNPAIAPPSPMPTLPLIKPIQDYDAVLHFINFYENKDKDQHEYDFGIEVIGPDQHGYDFGIEIIGPEQPF